MSANMAAVDKNRLFRMKKFGAFVRNMYLCGANLNEQIMRQTATLNQAQLQILDMMSFVSTPEALNELNQAISDYFVQKADAEMDKMWNEGTLSEDRIEGFRHLHERTPYNKSML